MVFLTRRLFIRDFHRDYIPYFRHYQYPNDSSWRKEQQDRLSWHFYGRPRNCHRLQKVPIMRSLRYSTVGNAVRQRGFNHLWSNRIAGACSEHGVQYSSFMQTLSENNILLNKKMLSTLSIYEPKSFQSLCEFVKKHHTENVKAGLAAALEPTPSGVVTKEMIESVFKS